MARWTRAEKLAFARKLRRNPTPAESVLWRSLRWKKLGTRFFPQEILCGYIVDFWAPDASLIIEVDGGYHATRRQRRKDRVREGHLKAAGHRVLRFKNEEVLRRLPRVLQRIKEELNRSVVL